MTTDNKSIDDLTKEKIGAEIDKIQAETDEIKKPLTLQKLLPIIISLLVGVGGLGTAYYQWQKAGFEQKKAETDYKLSLLNIAQAERKLKEVESRQKDLKSSIKELDQNRKEILKQIETETQKLEITKKKLKNEIDKTEIKLKTIRDDIVQKTTVTDTQSNLTQQDLQTFQRQITNVSVQHLKDIKHDLGNSQQETKNLVSKIEAQFKKEQYAIQLMELSVVFNGDSDFWTIIGTPSTEAYFKIYQNKKLIHPIWSPHGSKLLRIKDNDAKTFKMSKILLDPIAANEFPVNFKFRFYDKDLEVDSDKKDDDRIGSFSFQLTKEDIGKTLSIVSSPINWNNREYKDNSTIKIRLTKEGP